MHEDFITLNVVTDHKYIVVSDDLVYSKQRSSQQRNQYAKKKGNTNSVNRRIWRKN